MNSIRLRLLVMLTVLLGITGGLGYESYRTFNRVKDMRRSLDISYLLRENAWQSHTLSAKSTQLKQIEKLRSRVTEPQRLLELSNLIQAANSGNPRLLSARQKTFIKNEAEFQRYTRKQLSYMEQRLLYFGSLVFLTLCFGFIGLQLVLHRSVIRPLDQLSRKMVDFLHDRYTYQFSVPSNDEIGQMQATFNSLAQRVLANVEQLRTLDQAKSEFLSIASHELRTPLTSIKGSLSLMRSGIVGKMNEMAENLLGIAETETDRLIRLINDILDLAKIEARKLPLHQEWSSLNELVSTSIQSLNGFAQQAGVRLEMDATAPIETYMDRDRIQQVITNLMSNAIKFSPESGVVTVRCSIDDKNRILIEVKDQGPGIAPEDQEAIFQKFRQASSDRNPLVKGTGLGLAIARALVEQHGGEIGLSSQPGNGSIFHFSMPEWRYSRNLKNEAHV